LFRRAYRFIDGVEIRKIGFEIDVFRSIDINSGVFIFHLQNANQKPNRPTKEEKNAV
jgi:hypothetical protein